MIEENTNIPKHIAIIMDGNGRWARKKGVARMFGHRNGVTPVREVVEASGELGVEYLTLYAFSTENWSRPPEEVKALMALLVSTIKKESKKLDDNNVRFSTIGDISQLPNVTREQIRHLKEKTSTNTGLNLALALSYSARWEILKAVRDLMNEALDGKVKAADIDEEKFGSFLATSDIPDPELLIRTGGEQRVSNFLLYQIAYSELFFTDKLWPDFSKEDYYAALLDFQSRERRFGKTSEQL